MADFGINPNIAMGFQPPKTQSIADLVGTAKGLMEFQKLSELYPAMIERTKAESRSAVAGARQTELANRSAVYGKIAQSQVSMFTNDLVEQAAQLAAKNQMLPKDQHDKLVKMVTDNAVNLTKSLGIPWESKDPSVPSGKEMSAEYINTAINNPGGLQKLYDYKIRSLLQPTEQAALLHGELVTGPDGQPAVYNKATRTMSPVRYGPGGNVPPPGRPALGVAPENAAPGSVPAPGGVTAADMTRAPGTPRGMAPGGFPVQQALPPIRFPVRQEGGVAPILPEEKAAREGGQTWYNNQVEARESLLPARRDVQNVLVAANTIGEGGIPSTGPWAKLKKTVAELKGDDEYQFLNKSLAGLAARTASALGGASANTQGGQSLVQASIGTETYSPKVLKKIAQNLDADFTHLDLRGAAADQFMDQYKSANIGTFRQAWANHANPMVFKAMNIYRDAPDEKTAAKLINEMIQAEGVSDKQRQRFATDYDAINDMANGKFGPYLRKR